MVGQETPYLSERGQGDITECRAMGIDSEVLKRHSRQMRMRLRDNSIGSACSEWSAEAKGGRPLVFDYRQRWHSHAHLGSRSSSGHKRATGAILTFSHLANYRLRDLGQARTGPPRKGQKNEDFRPDQGLPGKAHFVPCRRYSAMLASWC